MPFCAECGHELSTAPRRCPSCGAPQGPTTRARGGRRRLPLVLGCGLVVLIVGAIGAAIAMPDFLDALERARQKRTMSELQEVSRALEAYREEHDGALFEADGPDALAARLEPDYLDPMPRTDAWGHPWRYACWAEEVPVDPTAGGCDTYRLVSPGSDGRFEEEDPRAYEPGTFPSGAYERDVVVGDGFFYRYPGEE